tara:strand:- start:55 stop:234 length:180 start_codon:yes stop_codon:yes gene_type:complete
MKPLIDAIGRERANTLMEQAVADAIRDNQKLGLSKPEQYPPGKSSPEQEPSPMKQVPIA